VEEYFQGKGEGLYFPTKGGHAEDELGKGRWNAESKIILQLLGEEGRKLNVGKERKD